MQIQYDDYLMLFRIGNDETNVFMIDFLFVCLFVCFDDCNIYIQILQQSQALGMFVSR